MAISGWGVFLIILVLVVLFAGGGYILYTQYRARSLGLPPPSLNPFSSRSRPDTSTNYRAPAPAPGGVQGWVTDKWHALRSATSSSSYGRTAGGAYEGYGGSSTGGGGRRGFGALDPDEAWDARVDQESGIGGAGTGYYHGGVGGEEDDFEEEHEGVGLRDLSGGGMYAGGGYGDARGRQRELDARYEAEMHGKSGASGAAAAANPFGEAAEESSLRSVSPRPDPGHAGQQRRAPSHQRGQSSLGTAGSAEESPTERRSMFREDV